MGLIRYVIGTTGSVACNAAGGVGAAGTLIDNGKGYPAKIFDGLEAIANVSNFYPTVMRINDAVRAYDTATARQFVERYAPDFERLTAGVSNAVDNISNQPVETGAAMLTLMGLGYALGRGFSFWKTKGQGGILTRAERRFGNYLWPETR
ncbi:hypothetical protein HY640_01590 [Candidatus Woesearchaeota archaeon]|nr:hypothetical protein [Candidatus Woesearchaeota archaeon]